MKVFKILLLFALVFFLTATPAFAFKFDIWNSGVSLPEAYNIAKYNDIRLRKSDYSGTPTQPLLSKEYDDKVLDQPVKIVLFFTPESKKLYRVYVAWNRDTVAKRISGEKIDAMYQDLEKILSSKYAKGSSIISSTYEKSFQCEETITGLAKHVKIRKSAYSIELQQSVPCNWLSVTYKDTKLSQLNFQELKRRDRFSNADYRRF